MRGMRLLFDMDGPLCRSREVLTTGVALDLMRLFRAGVGMDLVTGSAMRHVKAQMGGAARLMTRIWTDGGSHPAAFTQQFIDDLRRVTLEHTRWRGPVQGDIVEVRSGSIYLAVCGVDALPPLRRQFSEWARESGERLRLAGVVSEVFGGDVYVTIGGSVSLDVYPHGTGKHTVPVECSRTIFFCDSLGPYGGDTRLAERIVRGGGSVVLAPSPEATRVALARLYPDTLAGYADVTEISTNGD